jgi:hypothetical protein
VGDTGSTPVRSDSKRSTPGRKKWPVMLDLSADGGVSLYSPLPTQTQQTDATDERGRRRYLIASPTNADPDDQLSLSPYLPISRHSSSAEFLEEEEADALEGAGDLEAMATAQRSIRSIASAKSASSASLVPQEGASGRPYVDTWHGPPGADDSQELAGAVSSIATSPAANRSLFDAFELFLRSQVFVCRCLCQCLLRLCLCLCLCLCT